MFNFHTIMYFAWTLNCISSLQGTTQFNIELSPFFFLIIDGGVGFLLLLISQKISQQNWKNLRKHF